MARLPARIFIGSHHNHHAAHLAVAQPAQLRACDLIGPGPIDMEFERNLHARYDVLFGAEFPHKEIVDHIARLKQKQNVALGRYPEGAGNDVVFRRGIRGIEPQRIARRVVDALDIRAAENAIRPGIVEIPRELVRPGRESPLCPLCLSKSLPSCANPSSTAMARKERVIAEAVQIVSSCRGPALPDGFTRFRPRRTIHASSKCAATKIAPQIQSVREN